MGPYKESYIRLFVGNLSFDTNEQDLEQILVNCGNLKSCAIQRTKDKVSRGFAHIEFATEQECFAAFRALDCQEVKGRKIHVDWCDANLRELYPQYGTQTRRFKTNRERSTKQVASKRLPLKIITPTPALDFVETDPHVSTISEANGSGEQSERILLVDDAGHITKRAYRVILKMGLTELFRIYSHIQKLILETPDAAKSILEKNEHMTTALLHIQAITGLLQNDFLPLSSDQLAAARKKRKACKEWTSKMVEILSDAMQSQCEGIQDKFVSNFPKIFKRQRLEEHSNSYDEAVHHTSISGIPIAPPVTLLRNANTLNNSNVIPHSVSIIPPPTSFKTVPSRMHSKLTNYSLFQTDSSNMMPIDPIYQPPTHPSLIQPYTGSHPTLISDANGLMVMHNAASSIRHDAGVKLYPDPTILNLDAKFRRSAPAPYHFHDSAGSVEQNRINPEKRDAVSISGNASDMTHGVVGYRDEQIDSISYPLHSISNSTPYEYSQSPSLSTPVRGPITPAPSAPTAASFDYRQIVPDDAIPEASADIVDELLQDPILLRNICEASPIIMTSWTPQQRHQVLSLRKALKRRGYFICENP